MTAEPEFNYKPGDAVYPVDAVRCAYKRGRHEAFREGVLMASIVWAPLVGLVVVMWRMGR